MDEYAQVVWHFELLFILKLAFLNDGICISFVQI